VPWKRAGLRAVRIPAWPVALASYSVAERRDRLVKGDEHRDGARDRDFKAIGIDRLVHALMKPCRGIIIR
jgi:hypothetical protein